MCNDFEEKYMYLYILEDAICGARSLHLQRSQMVRLRAELCCEHKAEQQVSMLSHVSNVCPGWI